MLGVRSTGALLAAILGSSPIPAGLDFAPAGDQSHLRPAPRRHRKMRGQGKGMSYTKRGPGRRARSHWERTRTGGFKRVGQRRLPYASGPDSINAGSIALRMIGSIGLNSTISDVKRVEQYIADMRRYGHSTGLLNLALRQHAA